LVGFGLVILYSAGGERWAYVERQGIRFLAAFGVMFVVAQFEPSFYKRWSVVLFVLGVIALLGVMFFGVGAKGAQRWLQLPGLPRFQPSELMKLIVPMMAAWY
ncbi:FtsW/RodA/SpoVE family cell cycle protein, partial [Oleiphilus sp. HI0067]